MGEALITRRGGDAMSLSNARFTSDSPTYTWYDLSNSSNAKIYQEGNCVNLVAGQTYILKYQGDIIGYGVATATTILRFCNFGTRQIAGTSINKTDIEFYEIN